MNLSCSYFFSPRLALCGRLVNRFATEDIVDLSAIPLCQARIILISVILVTHRLKSRDETSKTQGEVGKKNQIHCKIKVVINTATSTEYTCGHQ